MTLDEKIEQAKKGIKPSQVVLVHPNRYDDEGLQLVEVVFQKNTPAWFTSGWVPADNRRKPVIKQRAKKEIL